MGASFWDWSNTAASNSNADSGINYAENQAANTLNDSARVGMKRHADVFDDIFGVAIAGGTANALTVTCKDQFAAYSDGMVIGWTAASANTGATTVNGNAVGAATLYAHNAACTGGEMAAGGTYFARYATEHAPSGRSAGFHLLNPRSTTLTLSGASSLTVSSSSDAFKITQTGSGNSLVVEDAASTDATPFVIDTNGNEILGHTAALATYLDDASAVGTARTAKRQQHGADNALSMQAVTQWANSADGANVVLAKSRSGTVGTYTVVQSGDTLGSISFQGADGVDFAKGAVIKAVVNATPGSNDLPTRLDFMTTQDGSATPATGMSLNENGKLTLKTPTTATGSLNLPAGTAPTSPASGDIWAVSGSLNYYDGTATRVIANANLWSYAGLTLAAGGTLYATGAGALAQLAIGTAGQQLTVNTGATAPQWSSPAMQVILAETNLTTGVTSQTFSVDFSTYEEVIVHIDNLSASGTGVTNINVYMAVSGTITSGFQITAANYLGGAVQAAADRFGGTYRFYQNNVQIGGSNYYSGSGRAETYGWDASATTFFSATDAFSHNGTMSSTRPNGIVLSLGGGPTINGGVIRIIGRRRSF